MINLHNVLVKRFEKQKTRRKDPNIFDRDKRKYGRIDMYPATQVCVVRCHVGSSLCLCVLRIVQKRTYNKTSVTFTHEYSAVERVHHQLQHRRLMSQLAVYTFSFSQIIFNSFFDRVQVGKELDAPLQQNFMNSWYVYVFYNTVPMYLTYTTVFISITEISYRFPQTSIERYCTQTHSSQNLEFYPEFDGIPTLRPTEIQLKFFNST